MAPSISQNITLNGWALVFSNQGHQVLQIFDYPSFYSFPFMWPLNLNSVPNFSSLNLWEVLVLF